MEQLRTTKAENALRRLYVRYPFSIRELGNSKDPTVVQSAIRATPDEEHEVYFGRLKQLARDSRPVWRAISAAYGHWEERGDLRTVLLFLNDDNEGVRSLAARQVLDADRMLGLLKSKDNRAPKPIRLSIQELIRRSRAPGDHRQAILYGLNDRDLDVRSAAAQNSAGFEIAIDLPVLQALLSDRDPGNVNYALAIAAYANKRPGLVVPLLTSRDKGTSYNAAFMLLACGTATDLPLVRKHLRPSNPEIGFIRSCPATIVAGIERHGIASAGFVHFLLNDQDSIWKCIGLRASPRVLGKQAFELLHEASLSRIEEERCAAAIGLVKLSGSEVLEDLMRLLRDPSKAVRESLHRAMKDYPERSWIDLLQLVSKQLGADERIVALKVADSIQETLADPKAYRFLPASLLENPYGFVSP